MHSSYLVSGFDPTVRKFVVSVLVRYLQPKLIAGEFTHIYVRGVSGLTIGSMVAYELEVPLMVLRKEGEQSHGQYVLEGWTDQAKAVIIDDLICSGATVKEMVKRGGNTVVGACLYQSFGDWEFVEELSELSKLKMLDFHSVAAYTDMRCYNATCSPTELAGLFAKSKGF